MVLTLSAPVFSGALLGILPYGFDSEGQICSIGAPESQVMYLFSDAFPGALS